MNKWICLLLIVLALSVGILIGERLKQNTMTMEVSQQGKVYAAPKNGDVLNWVASNRTTPVTVTWNAPPQVPFKSPCKEESGAAGYQSSSCTVKFKTNTANYMYHYQCLGCGDPILPGPGAYGLGGEPPRANSTGGNVFSAIAAPNQNVSGVWYYSSDTSVPSGFVPIPASSYPAGSNKYDQVVWEPQPDGTTHWQVVVPSGTCQGNVTTFSDAGPNTCTITATASLNYCVVYANVSPGNAVLLINDPTLPTNKPPAPCPQ